MPRFLRTDGGMRSVAPSYQYLLKVATQKVGANLWRLNLVVEIDAGESAAHPFLEFDSRAI